LSEGPARLSAMVTFTQLESWIRAGDIGRVVTALLDADEQTRRALATDIKGIRLSWPNPDVVMGLMDFPAGRKDMLPQQWALSERSEAALRIAGAACLPRAADIVSWLRSDRFPLQPLPKSVDGVVRVLRAAGRPSLPAIARPLADRLRPAQVDTQWPLIIRLLDEAELPLPVTEATVRGWMRGVGEARYRKDLADLLRADPRREQMLPHVFTVPLIGQELDEEWTKALTGLAADGILDRQALLDGCALRLRAGDRTGPLRRFVVLHRLLSPSAEEVAARRGEYCGMLSSPDSMVAGLALLALRRAADAGLLETQAVAEAALTVLSRKEKKLVRAQLDWLGATLAADPDPSLFEALVSGLANPAGDLAERALGLIARYLPSFGEAGSALLTSAADGLQGDLRRQVLDLLGHTDAAQAEAVTSSPPALPAVVPAAPMPAPIASIPELVAEARHLLREQRDPVRVELVLDALVRFTAADRPALAHALEPLLSWRVEPFANLLHAVVNGEFVAWFPSEWERRERPPFWMLIERMAELSRQMCRTPPPALLATPATVDGHVDPARVLRLLGEEWEPEPFDLSQALLRLPREVEPATRAAAGRLVSPAGKAFAAFLNGGGLPDPVVVTFTLAGRCRHGLLACLCHERPGRRAVAFEPIEHDLTVAPGLLHQPVESARERVDSELPYGPVAGWPMIVPSHREIAAAHLQPYFVEGTEIRGSADDLAVLPALAACDGPFGPAMALCLAYAVNNALPAGRLVAADTFVDLAARGVLDGSLVGRELTGLFEAGSLFLKRVADAFGHALAAGAATDVWTTLREMLPVLLSAPKSAAGLPDLLLIAEAAAAASGASDDVPELTSVAGRPGRSRLVTEAARLSRTLTENRAKQMPAT
jgi:hypothetical protein